MKVTKLIREYVAEQVTAKYPETEAEKRYAENLDEIQNTIKELQEIIKDYSLKLCEQANIELEIDDWDKNDKIYSFDPILTYGGYNSPYARALNEKRNERKEKINKAIKDILINLELGATKAELDEMLKKLGEEG